MLRTLAFIFVVVGLVFSYSYIGEYKHGSDLDSEATQFMRTLHPGLAGPLFSPLRLLIRLSPEALGAMILLTLTLFVLLIRAI